MSTIPGSTSLPRASIVRALRRGRDPPPDAIAGERDVGCARRGAGASTSVRADDEVVHVVLLRAALGAEQIAIWSPRSSTRT